MPPLHSRSDRRGEAKYLNNLSMDIVPRARGYVSEWGRWHIASVCSGAIEGSGDVCTPRKNARENHSRLCNADA